MFIPRRDVWRFQPQYPVEIDHSHPLAKGLVFAFDPVTQLALPTYSLLAQGIANGKNNPSTTAVGKSLGTGRTWSGNYLSWCQGTSCAADLGVVSDRKITFAAIAAPSQTAAEARVIGFGVGGATSSLINLEHTTIWRLQLRNHATTATTLNGPSVVVNKPVRVMATVNGTGGATTLSVDGGDDANGTGPGGTIVTLAATVGYLDRASQEQIFAGWMANCYIWARVLEPDERNAWFENPWQMLRKIDDTIISLPAGGIATPILSAPSFAGRVPSVTITH